MLRNGDALAGVGLLLLWLAGLVTRSTQWLTWVNLILSICAFYLAAYGKDRAAGPAGTIALACTLFVSWIVALAQGATGWLSWATFGIACFILLVGIGSALSRFDSRIPPRITRPTP